MTDFTPLQSLAGGMLIGLAAVILMATNGRIAGMTGILGGLMPPWSGTDWLWRLVFLAAAICASAAYYWGFGFLPTVTVTTPHALLVVGGFLVGIGVTFGGGCTSGHGVCGISRLSPRSFVATGTFMVTTVITVYVMRHVIGG
ncbi:MAG: YeeE/YedE family protein [Hyphomicrobiaceae bacterium]